MPRTLDLFERPPRAKPKKLMHVSDAGEVQCGAAEDLGKPLVRFMCARCEYETDWFVVDTVTEAKRGIPCPKCNNEENKEEHF